MKRMVSPCLTLALPALAAAVCRDTDPNVLMRFLKNLSRNIKATGPMFLLGVALDQACIDIVSQADGNESLMRRIERQQGIHTLEHAEEIGLGSRSYRLVDLS